MRNSKTGAFSVFGMMVAVLVCVVLFPNAAHAAFSNATLNGSYGFLTTRFTADTTQNAHNTLGILTFDGVSAVTYSTTTNDAGTIKTSSGSGTYSVNANGTGTITLTDSGTGQTITLAISINTGGKSFQLLKTSCNGTCNNEVDSGTAVAQQGTSFTNANLKGAYGFLTNTWTPTSTVSAEASVGIASFDGVSKAFVILTDNKAGTVKSFSESGTYSVNPDGSGSVTLTNKAGTTTFALVLNSAGKQVQFMVTSCNGTCSNEVQSGTGIHQ